MTKYTEMKMMQEAVSGISEDARLEVRLLYYYVGKDSESYNVEETIKKIATKYCVVEDVLKFFYKYCGIEALQVVVYGDVQHSVSFRKNFESLPRLSVVVAQVTKEGATYNKRWETNLLQREELLATIQEALFLVGRWEIRAEDVFHRGTIPFAI